MNISKIFALSFFFSGYVFSFGGIVTDPGSYTYYATQIETALKQLKQAESQLKTATDTYKSVTSIDKRLTGNLQRAHKSLKNAADLKESSIRDTRKSIQYATKALDEVVNISDYKEDIEDQIDDVFGDSDRNDWVSLEIERKASKQKALKQSIIDAETAQGKADLQLEYLEEYSIAANSTDTSKDSQDVTNALLLKMVENQGELITIMANVSKNLALSEYDGNNKNSEAHIINGKDLLKPEDWKSPTSGNGKTLSEMMDGCNPFDGCKPTK